MKYTKRIRSAALLILFTVLLLTGCTKFDCSKYIQAMMDSMYKGDHKVYADLTNLSEDHLNDNYEEGINAEIEKLLSYMNISDSSSFVNEETRSHARDFFKKVYMSANYMVGQADQKGYVTITIAPIQLFTPAKAELESYVHDFFSRNDAGEFADMADEDFYSLYIQGALDILSRYADQISYGDPKVISVHVTANSQNVYSITDEDFLSIDQFILDYQN